MSIRKLLVVLWIAVLATPVLANQSSTRAQGDEPFAPQGLRPDAPPYAVHGPYAVGTREFVIEPDSERPLALTVWYPALNPDGLEESVTYMIEYPPALPQLPITGHALQDASPDTEHGPYPLVLFSHGAFGWRYSALYFIEHIASYGFVVMSVDHTGDTPANMEDEGAFVRAHVNRPKDITREIDFAEGLTAASGPLAGMIDTQHVAVSGDSSGGWTALLAAGARRDYTALRAWCAEYPDDVWTCGNLLGQEQVLADLLGLQAVPEGLWPSVGDPRIDAAVMFVPGNIPAFGKDGLAAVTVPSMVLAGSADVLLPFDQYAQPAYEGLGSQNKTFVVFEGGGHTMFGDSCSLAPWLTNFGLFWLCSDSVWDMDRAHDLSNHFTTAFLLATLKGDEDAAAVLAPDTASFPGITYETTGF
jgi:predicted dienelactone hydrolase